MQKTLYGLLSAYKVQPVLAQRKIPCIRQVNGRRCNDGCCMIDDNVLLNGHGQSRIIV